MVSKKLKQIMKLKKVTNIQLAEHLEMLPQSLANKFSRDSISASELIDMLEFMGCHLIVEVNPDINVKFNKDDIKK